MWIPTADGAANVTYAVSPRQRARFDAALYQHFVQTRLSICFKVLLLAGAEDLNHAALALGAASHQRDAGSGPFHS